IEAFKQSQKEVGHIKKKPICAFPARFLFLKKKNALKSNRDPLEECPDLKEWMERLSVKKLYMVFAGPYPSNPASMFGHSFIRLSRENEDPLLDYVVGFRATTDPTDNFMTYAAKGIFGGYTGFYNLKPNYLNVGLYNNSESRDLWEYELKLNNEEIQFFLYHLWELSNNTGFRYYFFDENCSFYLLTLLETVNPKLKLTESYPTFVHPIETIKKSPIIKGTQNFRPSVKKFTLNLYQNLSSDQRSMVRSALHDIEYVKKINDPKVLEVLGSYWKYKNYEEQTNLPEEEKKIFSEILEKRSTLGETNEVKIENNVWPIRAHSPSKIETYYKRSSSKERYGLSYEFGYHGKNDSEEGISRWSFIDYFGFQFEKDSAKSYLDSFKIVDILSLEDFDPIFKMRSWKVKVDGSRDCYHCNQDLMATPEFGVGLSFLWDSLATWTLISLDGNINKETALFYPSFDIGLKLKYKEASLVLEGKYFSRSDRFIQEYRGRSSVEIIDETGIWLDFLYRSHDSVSKDLKVFSAGLKKHF
ncbi:MAG: DUF4105 domain-containing protein, partial [Bacteriovoracaceae bacterium]